MIKKIAMFVGFSLMAISCADDESTMESPVATTEGEESSMSASGLFSSDSSKSLYVKVPHLYVRTGPGMKYQAIGTIPFNKEVKVLQSVSNGAWIKIGEGQYVGGRYLSTSKNEKAWIPAKYAH